MMHCRVKIKGRQWDNLLRFFPMLTTAILLSTSSFAQQHDYETIIGKADSIVKGSVPLQVMKYFSRDSTEIKYEFRTPRWQKYKTRHDKLTKGQTTKGEFKRTFLYYHFRYKESMINDPLVRGYLPGGISLVFDSKLNQTEEIDVSFIPKYVIEERPCDFITMDKAIALAVVDKIKNGLRSLDATLSYNSTMKNYCWWVSAALTEEKDGNSTRGEADTVTIDAVTGKILSHEITYYGPLH